jgi:hypothetical protein
MNGMQQPKWQKPYEQKFLWDDCSSEPFVASCTNESPTERYELLERIKEIPKPDDNEAADAVCSESSGN